jgi:hypothetical protein
MDPLDSEEVLVISVKDEDKYKGDSDGKDKDDEPQGRMASEHLRSAEESMTSIVGKKGTGSNPKIQCTPASDDDDEGNDLDIDDGDYLGEMMSDRSQGRAITIHLASNVGAQQGYGTIFAECYAIPTA